MVALLGGWIGPLSSVYHNTLVRGEGGGGPYHLISNLPGPGGRAGTSRLVLICCKGVDRHFLYL